MVNFLKTNNAITLHYDGKTKLVAAGDATYGRVLAAIRENRLDDIPEIVEPERALKAQGLDIEDGLVTIKGEAMPTELNDRILAYKDEGLPFDSLIKFWENLKLNPSFNSRKELFKFLSNNGHSITPDGCFIGYRGVREDFKDKYSGKFDNSPGNTVKVPRTEVDDNPNNDCSFGLHVGGFKYAKDFGPKLVMVKVNPKNVVAVPASYDGQKMRVCEFEVLCETSAPLEKPVYQMEHDDLVEAVDEAAQEVAEEIFTEMKKVSIELTPAEKRKRTLRYKNNHAKRGKDGKFIAKKKAKKRN